MKYLKQPFAVISNTLAKTAKGFVTDDTGIYVTAKELAKTLQDARANTYGSSRDHDITYTTYNPKSVISNSTVKQVDQSSKEINGRN